MAQAPPAKEEARGVPAWVMTFADLMTLLMCFFVLLLSFSEMDVAKFKQLSGSMKEAFGVQSEIEVKTIPKGTSVVAQEFSPGKPEPTALNQIRQFTIDSNRNTLDALERELQEIKETREHAKRLRMALREEIEKGSVSIQTEGMKVIVHLMENASFDSGYADVRPEFIPVLSKIADLIDNNSGDITVSGHTDDVPIRNVRFRSNWELSTSRAVSVAHELLKRARISPERVTVTGHADTRPRADNTTDDNRAKNRRVDVSIVRGKEIDQLRSMSITEAIAGRDEVPPAATDNEEAKP
ncbi:MAG: type VI secretion system protein TssL, long form [Gammaproteobacteria bacterium]|nr:type VI secretion system protein TssL, long form [Gammaproteobacteria bacterium]